MRILITGVDGYLGWPLSIKLAKDGHDVAGIDDFSRRRWVAEVGADSALPVASMAARLAAFEEYAGAKLAFFEGDLTDFSFVRSVYEQVRPQAVVYLGEMPSAPYSMIDAEHAIYSQTNNVAGTLATLFCIKEVVPDCHLVKLGTMGEYGTPATDIPEGFFEVDFRGKKDRMMFPRKAGSWYHQSKVHDTHNVEMACRIWGLRSTDIMQGVVYGTRFQEQPLDPALSTRFDFDPYFGTVLNRFCAQAIIEMPLTVYGKGNQKRGFLSLRDTVACLTLALEHPAETGEYRTFNQFDRVYSVNELAETVREVGEGLALDMRIEHIDNPRIENEDHTYTPDSQKLRSLGYRPSGNLRGEIGAILEDLAAHRDRIEALRRVLIPNTHWDPSKKPALTAGQTAR